MHTTSVLIVLVAVITVGEGCIRSATHDDVPVKSRPTTTTTVTSTTESTTTTTTTASVRACCPTGGVWSEWTTTGECPTTCGGCNAAARVRTCLSEVDGCPCSGLAADVGPCGLDLCRFPTRTCCGTFKKSINGNTRKFFCGEGSTPQNPIYTCPAPTTTTTVTPTVPVHVPTHRVWPRTFRVSSAISSFTFLPFLSSILFTLMAARAL